ncbi:MAG: glycosyltransferase family 2 protein [Arenicellales bacterium]
MNRLSERLTQSRRLPEYLTHQGGPLNTVLYRPLRRLWFRCTALSESRGSDTMTVIIGVRNRSDYRLENALESLRLQTYDQSLLKVLIVDYNSGGPHAETIMKLCRHYGARHMRLESEGIWSKSRCLNAGIRATRSKYIMISDVDVVFSPNYLEEAVRVLKKNPLGVVVAIMWDLPEGTVRNHMSASELMAAFQAFDAVATPRWGCGFDSAVHATRAGYYWKIGGFDEFYEGWGREDLDVARRFRYLGLEFESIDERSRYFHQWHPRYEGLEHLDVDAIRKRNTDYYVAHHSIRRNPTGWGNAA